MSFIFDEDIVMTGTTYYREKRAELKPAKIRISVFSVIVGFLIAVVFGLAGALVTPFFTAPKFPVIMTTPAAHTGVEAGGILPVLHGVGGECGPDGGMIHAEARPLGPGGPGDWRTVKEIKMLPINLEEGKALARWRIPESYSPIGPWQGRITVWCNGAPKPWRSTFRFSLLGRLNG